MIISLAHSGKQTRGKCIYLGRRCNASAHLPIDTRFWLGKSQIAKNNRARLAEWRRNPIWDIANSVCLEKEEILIRGISVYDSRIEYWTGHERYYDINIEFRCTSTTFASQRDPRDTVICTSALLEACNVANLAWQKLHSFHNLITSLRYPIRFEIFIFRDLPFPPPSSINFFNIYLWETCFIHLENFSNVVLWNKKETKKREKRW